MFTRVPLRLGDTPHDYVLGDGVLDAVGVLLREVTSPGRVVVVMDSGLETTPIPTRVCDALVDADFDADVVEVPPGETSKSIAEAEHLWSTFAELGVERRDTVLALGGGAVGDLAGFCAATWQRGVRLVHVPTTSLAMADSAVGGKTGVNLPMGKNLVGAFHLPVLVAADLSALDTLPDREFRSGFAEVVKCALLGDHTALATLADDAEALMARDRDAMARALLLAVDLKAQYVRDDLHDVGGERANLNLGHTTAHALETEGMHCDVLHGEAVAVGLVVAARLARARDLCDATLVQRLVATLEALGLPTALPPGVDADALAARTRYDKKREAGRRVMVLPRRTGGAELADVDDDELLAAFAASTA